MKLMDPGTVVDGFVIGDCLHAGGMAHIYAVTFEGGTTSPFPMVMKVPKMSSGDGGENITSFEVEHQILQVLLGNIAGFTVIGGVDVECNEVHVHMSRTAACLVMPPVGSIVFHM